MQITRVELTNFRNHQHLVLDEIGRVLIIVGDNAVGKTNIIEALQLMSMHESFRRPKYEEIINSLKEEEKPTSILVDIEILKSHNTKQLIFSEGKKAFFYNKKERPAKELLPLLPAVLFTPDDLQIVKGPPEQRRDLLDSLGSRLSKTFAQIKSEYTKALRHKNSLLRSEVVDIALLESWNINLSKLGYSLCKHRMGLCKQLMEHASLFYTQISGGECLVGDYKISWIEQNHPQQDAQQQEPEEVPMFLEKMREESSFSEEGLYKELDRRKEEEIAAKRALVGPHKDDISFTISGRDARRFASQGQQRSISLSLKMAEIEILKKVSGKNPLLLLDDVMSELDSSRRAYFMDLIGEAGQTVITTTNLSYFSEVFLERATVVELKALKEESRV